MSDIPVGSPPVPPGRHAAPGGWYPDPAHPGQERYWDGWQWSRNTRPLEQAPGVHPYPGYAPTDQPYPAYQPPNASTPVPYPPMPLPTTTASGQANYTADGVRLAGWGWRLLAYVLDAVAFGIISQIVTTPIMLATGNPVGQWYERFLQVYFASLKTGDLARLQSLLDTFPAGALMLQTALSLALLTLYHLLFLRYKAATPGKLLCKLQVVPLDRGHAPPRLDWHQAGVRVAIFAVAGGIVGLLRLLDCLWPLWDSRRQALHDKAAQTQVITRAR